MKTINLKRVASDVGIGTSGVLLDEYRDTDPMRIIKVPFAVTLELPWRNNENEISCIPCGIYIAKRIISNKFGETFEVTNVPHRVDILFHWGSFVKDTLGCILIAEKFSWVNNQFMIQESKINPEGGFNEFMKRLVGINEFRLIIEKCYTE